MRAVLWVFVAGCLSCSSPSLPKGAETPAPPGASPEVAPLSEKPVAFRVSALFGDHMVLQQQRENPVWGWDRPGQLVTVSLADWSASTHVGADGRWQVKLPSLPA